MEFLFDNPFIVLILAALFSVSSVFKKAAENQKKSSNRPMEKKDPKPKSPFEDVKEIFKEVARNLQEEQSTFPTKKIKDVYQEKKIAVEQPVVQIERTETYKSHLEKNVNVSEPMKQQKQELEINESKLIESVVWSEILGPPRAKKPYYRSRK